ncbi:hypothetical protein [Christiangramia echinicola]|uniref:hypothetical protein n=1 Tax=Christiangramia echinicola TaxID=279359 RepID=UPI0003FFEC0E|nr:hypothetical protein [Christiangramia echinicola]
MVKQFILIGLCLVFFTTQSQIQKQPEWGENIKVLEETVAVFDIKIYNTTNPDVAVKIKNYSIEDDFLIVNVWERATRKSKISKFNLRCLINTVLNCETSCTLTLFFDISGESNMNKAKTRIELSNCEVVSEKNCERITWKPEDDSALKAKRAFQQISYFNKVNE